MMFRVSGGGNIKGRLNYNRADTIFQKFQVLTETSTTVFSINRMHIFPSDHRFTVTIMGIKGTIATDTVEVSSTVKIYSTATIPTPTISSTSNMSTGIGLLESRIVRAKTITTTFVEFVAISMRRFIIIIFSFCRCCVSFRNRAVSDIRPMAII